MKVGEVFKRLRLSLAACLVLAVAAGVLVATAGAQTPGGGLPPGDASGSGIGAPAFEGTSTNIPYLAWRGEEVRVVKCDDDIPTAPGSVLPNQTPAGFFVGNRASLFIEDWSGPQLNSFEGPKPVVDTFRWFFQGNED